MATYNYLDNTGLSTLVSNLKNYIGTVKDGFTYTNGGEIGKLKEYIDGKIADIYDNSDADINSIKEIVEVIKEDGTILTEVAKKLDKTAEIGDTLSYDSTSKKLNLKVLNNNAATTATKVTYDKYGRITDKTSLVEGDIPSISWSKITENTRPTTLKGYGIADAKIANPTTTPSITLGVDTISVPLNSTFNSLKSAFDSFKTVFDKAFSITTNSNGDVTKIQAKAGFYGSSYISAYGDNPSAVSGGGGSIDLLQAWSNYNNSTGKTIGLSAYLGNDLNTRVTSIKSTLDSLATNAFTLYTIDGNGNAVTDITRNGDTIVFLKNKTFVESDTIAKSSVLGLVKPGTTVAANKIYGVSVNSTTGAMTVSVPWTNENSNYLTASNFSPIENTTINDLFK